MEGNGWLSSYSTCAHFQVNTIMVHVHLLASIAVYIYIYFFFSKVCRVCMRCTCTHNYHFFFQSLLCILCTMIIIIVRCTRIIHYVPGPAVYIIIIQVWFFFPRSLCACTMIVRKVFPCHIWEIASHAILGNYPLFPSNASTGICMPHPLVCCVCDTYTQPRSAATI